MKHIAISVLSEAIETANDSKKEVLIEAISAIEKLIVENERLKKALNNIRIETERGLRDY